MNSKERLELLATDKQLRTNVATWKIFRNTPYGMSHRAELWETIKNRRAEILHSLDPLEEIRRSNEDVWGGLTLLEFD